MLNTVGIFIYIKYWEIRYVEHCGNIYLHTILGNTLCWALWEDLFTQNTEEYCMLNIVGRFIYTKYWGILYVEHCGKIIYTKDWGLLYVEHCGKIYLYTMLRNTLCWTLWGDLFIQNTEEYFLLNTVGIFIYIKDLEIRCVENCEQIYLHKILGNTLCWAPWEYAFTQNTGNYFMLNTGKMYLHKIPRNTVCWALWEDIFTKNIGDYFMLNTMGRFIYTKYWGILYVENCGTIYLHKILRNTLCWTLGIFIYTKYWGLLYVEHCWKNYLHKILGITLCWTLWEDYLHKIFGNTLCWTLGRFIYIKFWEILYVEHCGTIYLHKILRNTLCWTLGIFIYTKYWGLLYVEHCWIIYLHKILGITLCWTLWEDLFTQNIGDNFMLSTVGKFIYIKYWGLLYVEHCRKIYLHKILRITLCWALWENLFTQNTGDYFMLNTVGSFIYTKYRGILYVEHCGKIIYTKYWGLLYVEHCKKIYLHKIPRNTVCWALWEDLFTQNTGDYFLLNTVGIFIYTKYWGLLYVRRFIYTTYWGIPYVKHCGKIYVHTILRNTVCWALWEELFTQNTGDNFMLNTVGRLFTQNIW